jgi:single-strand DNA-binding protein
MSINSATVIGHLGGDPEVKFFESGACTARLTVYVNDKYSKNGELQEVTHRIPVEVWGKAAEYCSNYLRQGSHVAVMGSLTEARWTDQTTGQNRSRLMVKAQRVDNLTPKAKDQDQADENYGYDDAEF